MKSPSIYFNLYIIALHRTVKDMHELTTIILILRGINIQKKHIHEVYFRILKHF